MRAFSTPFSRSPNRDFGKQLEGKDTSGRPELAKIKTPRRYDTPL